VTVILCLGHNWGYFALPHPPISNNPILITPLPGNPPSEWEAVINGGVIMEELLGPDPPTHPFNNLSYVQE